jgi:hypothetical protein
MRVEIFALGLLLGLVPAFAQDEESEPPQPAPETKDAWLGCWTRVYDAAHLKQHPKQEVTALTLAIDARTPKGDADPGAYGARLAASFRGKTENYTSPETARCAPTSAAADRLHCLVDGFYLGQFSLERAGKNVKIVIKDKDDRVAFVPGIDPVPVVRLTADNPEHTVFVLTPTPCPD